jgi:competence protein ComEC
VAARVRDLLDAERERLALWLPVWLGLGVLVYFDLRAEPWPWLGAVLSLGIAVPLAALWRFGAARLLLTPLLAATLGFAAAQLATARAPPPVTSLPFNATIVTGRIVALETLPGARRVTLAGATFAGADGPLARTVRVRLRPTDHAVLAAGDTMRVRAMLRPVGAPVMPGGWDMQRDAFYTGLGGSGYALGPVEVLARAPPDGPAGLIRGLAETIAGRIAAVIPGSSGQVAVALLVGRQAGIGAADIAAFRDSGLAHLLSVSGLHLVIVIGISTMVARFLLALSEHASLFWPTRQVAALIALAVGGFYTVLTGAQVPTLRCFLMACLFTLALLTGRRPISMRGLAIAAALVVLTDPRQVLGASMHMSFAAVLALIAGYEVLRSRMPVTGAGWRRAWVFVLGLLMSSLLAGTATLPFGAYHFGQVQLFYVVANLVGVPLTSVLVMPAGMLALPLMLVDLEWLALIPMQWGIEATLWVAHTVAQWPAATLPVPQMPRWGLLLTVAGMAWAGLWASRLRWAGVPLLLLGVLSPLAADPPDILVSHDARLIAVRAAGVVHLQQVQGGSAFVRSAWLNRWGEADAAPLPLVGEVGGGAIQCETTGCLLFPRPGASAAYLARSAERWADCRGIGVIVSAEPARGLCPRPFPALVDRFTVWRDGPTAIWLRPQGAVVLTDRANRGARPWVPPPPTPRVRPPPKLPLAPTEGGPGTEPPDPPPGAS